MKRALVLASLLALLLAGASQSGTAVFRGSVSRIPSSLRAHMTSWHRGCPVPPSQLRLLRVTYHNESLSSPYHHELYSAWRCQTHGDWTHADMNIYRSKLAALASRYHFSIRPPTPLRPTNC